MCIGSIIKYTDRCLIDIVRITHREFLIQVHPGTQNKALLGTERKSPEKQFTVLYPETSLEFQRGIGQVDEQEMRSDGGKGICYPFI